MSVTANLYASLNFSNSTHVKAHLLLNNTWLMQPQNWRAFALIALRVIAF